MAAAGGAACAACKYQRRRCTPECRLAEYFPQDRPRLFRNAHRFFGLSNILKTLARVGPERRRDAMRTIVFEANAWEAYPAHGCVPIILELDHRIRHAQLQLRQVQESFKAYQQQHLTMDHQDHTFQQPDEMSFYFLDNIDEDIVPPRGSSTDSSSEKKAMKEPKMENGFTPTSVVSRLN